MLLRLGSGGNITRCLLRPALVAADWIIFGEFTVKQETSSEKLLRNKKEATTCMAIGAGVGILGGAAAVMTAAVCPLCIFVAPGLFGLGAYRRWKASQGGVNGIQND